MRNLVLTGFMGTGKSTVARILAERYGRRLIDTDLEVERRVGATIRELWAAEGEAAFRTREAHVLQTALQGSGSIIATGAGALLDARNRAAVQPDDVVVCLTCRSEALRERLGNCRDRPLLRGRSADELVTAVERLLKERAPVYELYAQVDTTDRTPEEVARDIGERFDLAQVGEISFRQTLSSRVLFGHGALGNLAGTLAEAHLHGRVLLVTDENVRAAGWPERISAGLASAGRNVGTVILPAGEEHKTLACLERVYRAAMEQHLDRDSIVLAVGGGVICDLAGLAAATYLRGIRLVHVPTTLVAQVDAAIGGKVGVDLAGGKNLIGAFYPADVVIIDPDALTTLSYALLRDGLAEMVKIGAVRSSTLLEEIEGLMEPGDVRASRHLIRCAVEEKLAVVRADPYDRAERMLLNFGHTIGHGLEAAALTDVARPERTDLSHGQAVSVGMVAEARLAVERGWATADVADRLVRILERFGLPTAAPYLDAETVYDFIRKDKKRTDGRARLAVPAEMGRGVVLEVSEDDVRTAVGYALGGHR